MILKLPPIPKHGIQLVVVPSERLPVDDSVDKIESEGKIYKVIDRFTFRKTDPFPSGMMFLAVGKTVTKKAVWEKYFNSDKLYFYIVEQQS